MKDEFVSNEDKHFYFMIGKTLASALSGFIAGVLVMGIIMVVIWTVMTAN